MIYDYKEKEGYVSLWVGKCKDYNMIDEYMSTVYLETDFEGDVEKVEQSEVWKKVFIFTNQSRDCEEELKEYFNYEYYNQFEYDFGLVFDEDFRETNVLDYDTGNLEILLDGFSYSDSFMEEVKKMNCLQMKCNTAVVLYDFKYEGNIHMIEHENICLHFLGYFKYNQE
ncbi:MAG: immunity 22 family protein [Clostridium sp.]|nr:immunity 22 family protein [Acetatifactor muris]MCM1527956.1 immunity 22 family protein [Bacteroides sp.]MCM1562406.1 immunity 22 family protein [Clostridium sp.]